MASEKGRRPNTAEAGDGKRLGGDLALLAFFVAASLVIYRPAFGGVFFSDDQHYVSDNAYVQTLDLPNLIAIWSPFSGVAEIVENYAPVHLTANAIAWQFFGTNTTGYHVLNAVVHALAAWLLVLVYRRFGIPATLAAALAALFLAHPANVEAVAWISQLKTGLSMALALGALLAFEARPRSALVLFALALLAKPTAVFALPVAALAGAFGIFERMGHWRWIAAWGGVFAVFALAEFAAFFETAGRAPPIYPELDVRFRSICAIALRYAVLAVSGRGMSMFRETAPAESWLDPWFVASLVLLGVLGFRLVTGVVAGRRESIFWFWAAISFAPISGVIPLPYPMADRYLYFILPGLLGGLAFAALDASESSRLRRWFTRLPVTPARAAPALCAAAALVLAYQAHARAGIWTTADSLMRDAAIHYPNGVAAKTRDARRRALAGDVDGTVEALRFAMSRGYNRLDHLLQDPAYHPLHQAPPFRALMDEMAREMIDRLSARERPSQMQWRVVAQAQVVLGELESAAASLEKAIAAEGPLTVRSQEELEALRRQLATRERIREWKRKREGGPPS